MTKLHTSRKSKTFAVAMSAGTYHNAYHYAHAAGRTFSKWVDLLLKDRLKRKTPSACILSPPTVRISVSIPLETYQLLDRKSRAAERSAGVVAGYIVTDYVEQQGKQRKKP